MEPQNNSAPVNNTPINNAGSNTGTASQNNNIIGILAYLGPLVILAYLLGKDSPFVKFHVKQGLVLFVLEIVLWFIQSLFYIVIFPVWMLIPFIHLAIFIFSIVGIINVIQGKEKNLPLVGQFASKFNF